MPLNIISCTYNLDLIMSIFMTSYEAPTKCKFSGASPFVNTVIFKYLY